MSFIRSEVRFILRWSSLLYSWQDCRRRVCRRGAGWPPTPRVLWTSLVTRRRSSGIWLNKRTDTSNSFLSKLFIQRIAWLFKCFRNKNWVNWILKSAVVLFFVTLNQGYYFIKKTIIILNPQHTNIHMYEATDLARHLSHVHTFYTAAAKQKQATEKDRRILDAHAERNIDNLCEHPYETGMQYEGHSPETELKIHTNKIQFLIHVVWINAVVETGVCSNGCRTHNSLNSTLYLCLTVDFRYFSWCMSSFRDFQVLHCSQMCILCAQRRISGSEAA